MWSQYGKGGPFNPLLQQVVISLQKWLEIHHYQNKRDHSQTYQFISDSSPLSGHTPVSSQATPSDTTCTCLSPENMKASLGSTEISTSWTKSVLFCRWYLTGSDSLTRPNDGRSVEVTFLLVKKKNNKAHHSWVPFVSKFHSIDMELFKLMRAPHCC